MEPGEQPRPRTPRSVLIGRFAPPVLIAVAGVVLIILGHGHYKSVFANRDSLLSALGVGFIVVSLMLILLNWMMGMSAESDADRAKEQAARDYFTEHGHWPDDES